MNLIRAALILLASAGVAVLAMLIARRRASEGGSFTDSDRASGVFGVVATGFSVLLGFLVFLAFESYDASRSGADAEALMVVQQVETALLLPEEQTEELVGELVCYGRWVIEEEWEQMQDGSIGNDVNPWGAEMFRSMEGVELTSPTEEAAYGKWLDQTSMREEARRDRLYAADGVIPTPLWFALFVITAVVVTFLLFYADPGEPARSQALLMGSVVGVIVAMMLLLRFLDDPYQSGIGGLEPDAMERTLVLVERIVDIGGVDAPVPCDAGGAAR